MLERIGFVRSIKLDWLNKTVRTYLDLKEAYTKDNEKYCKKVKEVLDEYLMEYIKEENRKKTISILTRTWLNVEQQHMHIRDRALELFKTADENEKIAIHWCMLMMAYPVFLDITATIGKLLNLQDGFSLSMVKRRIYEIWGERSTLKYAIDKIVRSITEWGVVEDGSKRGEYKRKEPFNIHNTEIKLLLIEAYLIATKKTYLQFVEVNSLNELFPFKLDLGLGDFHGSKAFNLNKMGLDIAIGL
ncbi:MAG: hypothetical protein HPY74_15535 [Firmicutes bacterium]|nr:hypothetical protein [Bacillota bacterium]